jgi:hypothetical protein
MTSLKEQKTLTEDKLRVQSYETLKPKQKIILADQKVSGFLIAYTDI